MTKISKTEKISRTVGNALRRLIRNDRGDFLVTPAIMILIAGSTLLVGGLVYMGTRSVAPSVNNSRQGVTLDDEGNVVEGGVGVIPVPSETPKPTPTATPRRVIREEVTVIEETQPPVYYPPTQTYDPYPEPTQHVEEYDDPCVDEPGNDIEPEDGFCPGHDDGGGGGTGGGGHGGTS
ncbi:MAG: hypothetical protein WD826_07775 [Actinomycetota bacterium]